MKNKGIVVVGSANMDMVVTVERYPQPGETLFGKTFAMFPGGKGANQAVAAAKLGGRVAFIGKMGNDVFCEHLSRSMEHSGVLLGALLHDPRQSTGMAMIMVNGRGENEIVVVAGSNMKLSPEEVTRKGKVFSAAGITLLQLEIPLETVCQSAEIAQKHGHVVILNPAPAQRLPTSLLQMIDILTPNQTEIGILTGSRIENEAMVEPAAKLLLEMGVKNVIVTLGERGCLLVTPERTEHFPAIAVRAVDTTAAGDAFNGALAFALAAGEDIKSAIEVATAVSAYSVTKMGAQSSMPSRRELKKFMTNRRP